MTDGIKWESERDQMVVAVWISVRRRHARQDDEMMTLTYIKTNFSSSQSWWSSYEI